ncbi:MAG: LruC domain-containing protein [Prevotella sp.]|nr:LruC domain-containing protein [Prevotella sp.]
MYDEQAVLAQDKQKVSDNAKQILGNIDPEQDWVTTTKGSIEITADADLQDIVKVQILTASPIMSTEAKVLNEAKVTKGQTVTLVFDAPSTMTRLIAACVNKEGAYRFKGFDIGQSEISFQKATTRAASTRASEGDYNFPAVSNFYLPLKESFLSYNAIRATRADEGVTESMAGSKMELWKNSGWHNERLWRTNSDYRSNQANYRIEYAGSDWYMQNYSIRRDVTEDLTDEEKQELQDIFEEWLFWEDNNQNRQLNNLSKIRNSEMVKLFNNQFVATGDPVILTPVQITSNDMSSVDVYYYYYNPADVMGMTEEQEIQYIKDLPKFMAIAPHDLMIPVDQWNMKGFVEFTKKSEYVLPYYGDAPCFNATTLEGYESDGKVYRIRNAYKVNNVTDYYMVYDNTEKERMDPIYGEDSLKLPFQMWQIFKKVEGNDTYCYLYNVGAHCFLDVNGDWNTSWTKSDFLENTGNARTTTHKYKMLPGTVEGSLKFKAENSGYKTNMLGCDINKTSGFNLGIWSDKDDSKGACDWFLDEYTGSWDFKNSIKTELKQISGDITKVITAQSFSIPKGYKVGFMMKKAKKDATGAYNFYYDNSYTNKFNGDLFGDGRLNKEINRFPDHFMGNANKDVIEQNDPRMAFFSANGKTYMTFEDGSDANFVDMIVEVTNGVELVEETPEPEAQAYTMCFEDRPNIADYDLNDVVLRCTRKNKTTLVLSLIAAGANDDVFIHGATGWANDSKEVHEIFNHTAKGSDGNRFINTVRNGLQLPIVSGEVTVDANTSIIDYLKGIYIENKSMGLNVGVASKGDPPYGIIIPIEFGYPEEYVPINKAYLNFIQWAEDRNSAKDWYLSPTE